MLSNKIVRIYRSIVDEAHKMVSKNVDAKDLTGKINYAAIFSGSDKEFDKITLILKENGTVSDKQPTGDYYLLKVPLITKFGNVENCRVAKPKKEHTQKGYVDFEVKDYDYFKNTYKDRPGFSVINNVHGIELIRLWDEKFNVQAFFPKDFY